MNLKSLKKNFANKKIMFDIIFRIKNYYFRDKFILN